MGRFCGKCGSPLDKKTGLCPRCDKETIDQINLDERRKRRIKIILSICAPLFAIGLILWGVIGWGSSKTVTAKDAKSAIEQLAKLGDDFGYENAMAELTEVNTSTLDGDNFFRLQQNYKGIPVYGRNVVCVTDEDGTQLALTGNPLDVVDEINLHPTVDQKRVIECLASYFGDILGYDNVYSIDINPLSDKGLCIFNMSGSSESFLAYELFIDVVFADGRSELYHGIVNAMDGKVYELSSLRMSECKQYELINNEKKSCKVDLNITKRSGKEFWELSDPKRRIRVYNVNGNRLEYDLLYSNSMVYEFKYEPGANGMVAKENTSQETFNQVAYDRIKRKQIETVLWETGASGGRARFRPEGVFVRGNTESWFDNDSLCLYANLSTTYDFYSDVLQLNGIGGDDLWIEGVCNDSMPYYGSTNAYCWAPSTWAMEMKNIVISIGADNPVHLDTVAHEYMHGIERCRSSMKSQGESGAIKEAMSDIFGELVEDWFLRESSQGRADWIHGKRNLIDPLAGELPSYYLGENWFSTSSEKDNGGVHINNTVLSHAAYLMWSGINGTESKKIPTETLAKLWYRAMLMMPSNCSFKECRTLVLLAAENMGLTEPQIECVSEAFDAVGLTDDVMVDYIVRECATLTVLQSNGEPCDDYNVYINSSAISSHDNRNLIFRAKGQSEAVHTGEPYKIKIKPGKLNAVTISSGDYTKMTDVTFTVKTDEDSDIDNICIYTDAEKLPRENVSEFEGTWFLDEAKTTDENGMSPAEIWGDGYSAENCTLNISNGGLSYYISDDVARGGLFECDNGQYGATIKVGGPGVYEYTRIDLLRSAEGVYLVVDHIDPFSDYVTYWTKEVRNSDVEEPDAADPVVAFFDREIAPKYGQPPESISIPYRNWSFQNRLGGISFYETEEGPIALLGTYIADFNGDGNDDLMVASLDAAEMSDSERIAYNLPDDVQNDIPEGMCWLHVNSSVYLLDESGKALNHNSLGTAQPSFGSGHTINPHVEDVFSIFLLGNKLVTSENYDDGSINNSKNNQLFDPAIYDPAGAMCTHVDRVEVSRLFTSDISQNYYISRDMAYFPEYGREYGIYYDEKLTDENRNRAGQLYSSIKGLREGPYSTENATIEYLNTIFNETYGLPWTDFKATSWETRWNNVQLYSEEIADFTCSVKFKSESTGQISETTTGGITTIYLNPMAEIRPMKTGDNSFAFLPRRYEVCGSSHATGSGLNLNSDGTFTCDWIFWDFGDCGDEYPDGTCQISKFKGKFSNLTKVDEFTYKMALDYSEQWDQIGREYIENKKRYIVYDWDRFAGITEAYIYLPGTKYDFSTEGMVSVGDIELSDLLPYDVDWDELFGNGYVLHIQGMPVFISKSY